MVSIFQAISSGFEVLVNDSEIFFIVLICSIIPFGIFILLLLFRLKIVEDATAMVSGALCGGLLLDGFLSLLVFWLAPHEWNRALFVGLAVLVWGLDVFLWMRWQFSLRFNSSVGGFLLLIPVLLLLRLAFVSNLSLPLYTDSVEHYAIIRDLSNLANPPQSYYNFAAFPQIIYHYGYHSLVAKLWILRPGDLGRLILDYGQLLLAVGALGLFFPVYLATNDRLAGWVAVFSAGFVWSMPAYAVNWGKYPAIAAFALFPFVLGLLVFICKQNVTMSSKNVFWLILVVSISSLIFIHTRMLVVMLLLLFTIASVFLPKWDLKKLIRISITLISIISGLIIFRSNTIVPFFEIYWRFGKMPLLIASALCVISAIAYPRITMACLTFLYFSLLAVNINLPMGLEKYDALIDRPFLQIGLYILLSFMVATGIAGIAQFNIRGTKNKIPNLLALGLCLVLIGSAADLNVLIPSYCCNLVGEEDLFSYQWIRNNTDPMDSVLISAVPDRFSLKPVDGGAWVAILTNRPIVKVPYTYDLSALVNIEELCNQKIRYIYVGNSPYSFRLGDLRTYPNPYLARLKMQTVLIYELSCNRY